MSIRITTQENMGPGWVGRTAAFSTIMLVPETSREKCVAGAPPTQPYPRSTAESSLEGCAEGKS